MRRLLQLALIGLLLPSGGCTSDGGSSSGGGGSGGLIDSVFNSLWHTDRDLPDGGGARMSKSERRRATAEYNNTLRVQDF